MADPGVGIGGPGAHLFLDRNEARRPPPNFFWKRPSPLSKGLDDWPPPPPHLSQLNLDPALTSESRKSNLFYWFYIGYAHRSIRGLKICISIARTR